ncbi:MAG: ATP-binding cassette domain-containing protein, partial [Clostridia bacterium]|nr:ATP-binding cassette domain-containing protein [Clostridia bacterium]
MTLKAENLSKRYMRKTGQANYFYAVRGASLELRPGEVTVLMGRSGSGKTTLLHMLSGLLTPTEGRVMLGDTDLYALGDAALSKLRNDKIAVVPQGRSAIDSLTVLENVLLPGMMYTSGDENEARRWLEALDIAHLADARPAELSGGELRRMAIAR